jgi:hypothetical protein
VEQRVLATVKDAICFMKNLGEIFTSQTFPRSMGERILDA